MTQANHSSTPTECPDCHALVADIEAHKHWHARLVSDLANAVEHEIRRASRAPS